MTPAFRVWMFCRASIQDEIKTWVTPAMLVNPYLHEAKLYAVQQEWMRQWKHQEVVESLGCR